VLSASWFTSLKRLRKVYDAAALADEYFPLLVVMSGEVETSLEINDRGAAEIVRDSSTSLGMTEVLRQLFEQFPPPRPRFVARFFVAFAHVRVGWFA